MVSRPIQTPSPVTTQATKILKSFSKISFMLQAKKASMITIKSNDTKLKQILQLIYSNVISSVRRRAYNAPSPHTFFHTL